MLRSTRSWVDINGNPGHRHGGAVWKDSIAFDSSCFCAGHVRCVLLSKGIWIVSQGVKTMSAKKVLVIPVLAPSNALTSRPP